jgi:hypothetical protein
MMHYLVRVDRPDKPAHLWNGNDIVCHGFRRGKAGEWRKSDTPEGRYICSQCLPRLGESGRRPGASPFVSAAVSACSGALMPVSHGLPLVGRGESAYVSGRVAKG